MNFFVSLFKPFTDLSDFVRENDERNAREDALQARRDEINRINAKYRWHDYQTPAPAPDQKEGE